MRPLSRIRIALYSGEEGSGQEGFGLIELIIAMMILTIGLLAVVAGFSSGAASIVRASRVSTAATLADSRLETYRAIQYTAITLDTADRNDSTATPPPYASDAALSGSPSEELGTCAVSPTPVPPECEASREVIGPDGRAYRIDTYITRETPSGGRELKKVTVVVRDPADVNGTPLARQVSTFDVLTR